MDQYILRALCPALIDLILIKTSTTEMYISQLFFPHKPITPLRYACAEAGHLIAGAFAGSVFAVILERWRHDRAYAKGLAFGSVLWLVHAGVIPNLVPPRPYLFRTPLEAVVDLLSHLAFGSLAAWYLLRTVKQAGMGARP